MRSPPTQRDKGPWAPQRTAGGGAWPKFITLCSVKTNQGSTAWPLTGYGPLRTPRVTRRLAHLSTARARILDVLIDQPEPCTVAALSELIRQHPNTIREHLDTLLYDRLVVRTRADVLGRPGRPAWLYSAAPDAGSEPGSREYAALASALAAQISRTSRHPHADALRRALPFFDTVSLAPVSLDGGQRDRVKEGQSPPQCVSVPWRGRSPRGDRPAGGARVRPKRGRPRPRRQAASLPAARGSPPAA